MGLTPGLSCKARWTVPVEMPSALPISKRVAGRLPIYSARACRLIRAGRSMLRTAFPFGVRNSQSRRPNAQYTYLFREPPNAKGNWQPDHDHVHNQPLQHVVQFVGAPIL